MVLQRWDPFRDLRQMEDTVNRLWRGFGGSPTYREGVEDWNILIDVIQKPDSIIVKASMPGIETDAIDLTVEDNVLTLRAERNSKRASILLKSFQRKAIIFRHCAYCLCFDG